MFIFFILIKILIHKGLLSPASSKTAEPVYFLFFILKTILLLIQVGLSNWKLQRIYKSHLVDLFCGLWN